MRPSDTPSLRTTEAAYFCTFFLACGDCCCGWEVSRCAAMHSNAECFSLRTRPLVQTRRHLSVTKRGEAERFYRRASNVNPELLLSSPYFFFFHSQSARLLRQTAIYVLHLGGMGTVVPRREQKWLRTFCNAQVKGF